MAQQKQVPQQEQPPQDADAIFAAREAVLIDEVEALRRTRDEAEAGELITHIQDPKGRARGILARKGFEKLAAGHYRAPATAEASPNGTPADAAAVVSG